MKNSILSIAGICLLTAAVCALTPAQAEDSAQPKASAPAQAAQTDYIYLADPTIFYDQGTYYLYGTGNSNEGFWVYTSQDLKTWKGPVILGAHAEGPFINPKKKGAQEERYILKPDAKFVKEYADVIRIITLAPEMDEDFAAIKEIRRDTDVVISMGHTDADYE
ncbi:MAG: hypothetical protein J6W90_01350, partial [Verrucomicrobia bacterium]|nr:hypothetical protein [Verrucomicrobiota bacterium]